MADLHLSRLDGVNITRVFRSGLQLFPYHNLTLQLGDRVYCVGPENSVKRLAERLGDEEQKLNHPNMLSLFIGIALGILVGAVPITFPGMPVPVKLGVAGGPLVIAILLGSWGPRLRLITYMTPSANLMLREFGMVFFLASIGLAAGDGFAEALMNGRVFLYAALGAVITVVPALIAGIIALRVYHLNFHSAAGLIAGAMTDTPALAYIGTLSGETSRRSPTQRCTRSRCSFGFCRGSSCCSLSGVRSPESKAAGKIK